MEGATILGPRNIPPRAREPRSGWPRRTPTRARPQTSSSSFATPATVSSRAVGAGGHRRELPVATTLAGVDIAASSPAPPRVALAQRGRVGLHARPGGAVCRPSTRKGAHLHRRTSATATCWKLPGGPSPTPSRGLEQGLRVFWLVFDDGNFSEKRDLPSNHRLVRPYPPRGAGRTSASPGPPFDQIPDAGVIDHERYNLHGTLPGPAASGTRCTHRTDRYPCP